MTEALERLLEATLQIEGIDSGGVYLVDPGRGDLQLVSHTGLSPSFVDRVSYYAPESLQALHVMQGEPTYWPDVSLMLDMGSLLKEEGLTSLAVIPVKSERRVVAALKLGSHTQNEMSETTRTAIEAIGAQIGGIVFRVAADEALKVERLRLAELNAALKTLLRQREEDRTELEESLLANVKHLVMPYVDKLMEMRLLPDHKMFVEIIRSHLKEITSPFLRTLSRQFAGLTPMEIQVANLIKDGRATKDIAAILVASEKTVLFHRHNLRKKLGLTQKKINLRSYLCSLP
jgi:DNA-binding CsgD family transcriptional regulator